MSNHTHIFYSVVADLEKTKAKGRESVLLSQPVERDNLPKLYQIVVIFLFADDSILNDVNVANIPEFLKICLHLRMDDHEKIRIFLRSLSMWLVSFDH